MKIFLNYMNTVLSENPGFPFINSFFLLRVFFFTFIYSFYKFLILLMKEFQNMLRKEASGPFSQSLRKKAKDKQAVNPGSWQEEEDREEKRKILSFKLEVGHIHCSASV